MRGLLLMIHNIVRSRRDAQPGPREWAAPLVMMARHRPAPTPTKAALRSVETELGAMRDSNQHMAELLDALTASVEANRKGGD